MPTTLRRRFLDASLLGRLLEAPDLARRVQALPASSLREALQEIGIEDAGELIALTTFEQLRDVFDEDLWRSGVPGGDAGFDVDRFVVWLEVLREAGDAFVADRLAEFSEDFLAFAFSRLVRVIDLEVATAAISDADEADLLDKVIDSHSCDDLDGYLIVARIERGWDALWSSLLALDERHPELLRSLLRRNWLATAGEAEDVGGLYTLLTESEQLQEDAAAEREDRRAERGYVSPADARAFLSLARSTPSVPEVDPITRAYFRALAPAGTPRGTGRAASERGAARLEQLAARAQETTEAEQALAPSTHETLFRRALAELAQADPPAHQRIVEELAYLANVLVAGDGTLGRAWRPLEAAIRVVELCGAGLHAAVTGVPGHAPLGPGEALARWGATGLFRIAWSQLGGGRASCP
jgi:hypothetical protein